MIKNKLDNNKANYSALILSGFIIGLCSLLPNFGFSQPSNYDSAVIQFVDLVKKHNFEKIAAKTIYPLRREAPLSDITSQKEFLKRYHEVFDDSLVNLITHSNIKEDWSEMGWRGIMFSNGTLWLDKDGNLTSVNYKSKLEQGKLDSLLVIDKSNLYPELRNFKVPVLCWKTRKFMIRIDDLGNDHYRYASWPVNKDQSAKPDLILMNGNVEFDGSGGNHKYIFKNQGYTYVCSITVIGADDSLPYVLSVFKNEKEILNEPVKKIYGE